MRFAEAARVADLWCQLQVSNSTSTTADRSVCPTHRSSRAEILKPAQSAISPDHCDRESRNPADPESACCLRSLFLCRSSIIVPSWCRERMPLTTAYLQTPLHEELERIAGSVVLVGYFVPHSYSPPAPGKPGIQCSISRPCKDFRSCRSILKVLERLWRYLRTLSVAQLLKPSIESNVVTLCLKLQADVTSRLSKQSL
jgi:hypothetical protein